MDVLLQGNRQVWENPDFMLSEHLDEAAATVFFTRAIGNNGFPDRVVIDKSGANLAGLENMNCLLILNGWFGLILLKNSSLIGRLFSDSIALLIGRIGDDGTEAGSTGGAVL